MKTKEKEKNLNKKQVFVLDELYFLLGEDSEGTRYYLASPKWKCGWYWSFGYINSFTNNKHPEKSRDIESYQHANKFMPDWFTEWNGSSPRLVKTTFSQKEGWELSELFKQFYFLRECAKNFERGKCHVAQTEIESWKDTELSERINNEILPKVMKRIIDILDPRS